MGIILATFFFSLIVFGFTMLSLLPMFLFWLLAAVYMEPRQQTEAAVGNVPTDRRSL